MKTIAEKLWTEPAYFLGAVQVCLQVAQVLLVHDRVANAVIAVVLGGAGAGATRRRVTPTKRG